MKVVEPDFVRDDLRYWQHPLFENLWFREDGEVFTSMKKVGQRIYTDVGQPYRQLKKTLGSDGYYCIGTCVDGNRKKLRLARSLYEAATNSDLKEFFVDHINRCTTDDRLSNLRKATRAENTWNSKGKKRDKPCPYKSVYEYHGKQAQKNGKNFGAQLSVNGKYIWLGRYKTAELARQAYDQACLKYRGEFAVTNQQLGLIN